MSNCPQNGEISIALPRRLADTEAANLRDDGDCVNKTADLRDDASGIRKQKVGNFT